MKLARLSFLLFFAFGSFAIGQNAPTATDPQELIAMRGEFLRAMARAGVQPLSAYLHELELFKQQVVREGKSAAVIAVDAEIKSIQDQLVSAQSTASLANTAPAQIQIESAVYGDAKTKRVKDVVAAVQSAVDSGATIVVNSRSLGGPDPAPGTDKFLVVSYRVNGVRKQKTFKERSSVILKQELR
ncbi:MAG TPA: hypothetical protein VGM54_11600 [Chthoniobacter sp.]